MAEPVIVVLGAGPGVGASVARTFARNGYAVALVARSIERLRELGERLQAEGTRAGWTSVDLTDEETLRSAITRVGEEIGRIDVLHFNPSSFRHQDPLRLSPDGLLADVRLGVAPLLTAVQAARPFLHDGARITATGSMAADHPWHEACSLGVQKAALRNLVRSIDATLRPDGVRAMSLTVNGTLAEGTPFSPDRVAEALYAAATAPDEQWRVEVPYDG